jgi:hypothetical protein
MTSFSQNITYRTNTCFFPVDNQTRESLRHLRSSRHLHHNMHGISGSDCHLAYPPCHCSSWLPRFRFPRRPLPLLSTHKGSQWCLVHADADSHPLHSAFRMALWKRAAVAGGNVEQGFTGTIGDCRRRRQTMLEPRSRRRRW